MFTFLALLFLVLIGGALAIFGVIAALTGLLWLLWPLMMIAGVLILVGYLVGSKKKKKETNKKEEEDDDPEIEIIE